MIQRFCFVKLLDDEVGHRGELAEKLRAELTDAGADALIDTPADLPQTATILLEA